MCSVLSLHPPSPRSRPASSLPWAGLGRVAFCRGFGIVFPGTFLCLLYSFLGETRAMKEKAVAIYLRVSSKDQSHASQEPDLERWAASCDMPVKWFRDKASGRSMDRPGWNALEADLRAGKLAKIVVWKLDRLGRTACELLKLRDEIVARKVDLVCVMSGVMSLDSAEGRMMFGVIAQFAEFEREIRGERQGAGIARAKERGVYKGRKPGSFKGKPKTALRLRHRGFSLSEIAKHMGVSRETVLQYFRLMRQQGIDTAKPGSDQPA